MILARHELYPSWSTWDDPGDYPCGAAGGPLPSEEFVEEITGEVWVVTQPVVNHRGDPVEIDIEEEITKWLSDHDYDMAYFEDSLGRDCHAQITEWLFERREIILDANITGGGAIPFPATCYVLTAHEYEVDESGPAPLRVECPRCHITHNLSRNGWTAIACPQCGTVIRRETLRASRNDFSQNPALRVLP